MSNKISKIKSNFVDFFIDHPKTKRWSKWVFIFIVEIISSFFFAYGFKAFTAPSITTVKYFATGNPNFDVNNIPADFKINDGFKIDDMISPTRLISGGASGVSQAIIRFISIFTNVSSYESIMVSIFYFMLNVPIFILCFTKISKQFGFFTLVNVGITSLFNYIIPDSWVYNVINLYNDMLARALFAGICTGISSGLAMMVGTSTGGYDCITIYISEKKSTSVGKYSLILNSTTVLLYVLFSVIGHSANPSWNTQDPSKIVTTALYTIVYFFVSSKVVDLLNTKNRKQEMQIFTSNDKVPTILIHTFPHACTVVDSKGAFSGNKNYIIYMVISKSESKKAINMVKSADPRAFMTLTDINQVYGAFYIKPFD